VLHDPKINSLPLTASLISDLPADLVVLNSLLSHSYELTNEYSLSSRSASLPINSSRLTTSNYSSNLAWSWPPVHLQTCSIIAIQMHLRHRVTLASKCVPILTELECWSASPNSVDRGLKVTLCIHAISVSKCISKLARWRPWSASPNSLNHGLQLHLWVHSISSSKCISKLARPGRRNTSLTSPNHCVVEHWRFLGIQREYVRRGGSCSKSVGWGCEDMKGYLGMSNHTNCIDPWTFGKCAWDQELGTKECVFCIMRCLSTLESPN